MMSVEMLNAIVIGVLLIVIVWLINARNRDKKRLHTAHSLSEERLKQVVKIREENKVVLERQNELNQTIMSLEEKLQQQQQLEIENQDANTNTEEDGTEAVVSVLNNLITADLECSICQQLLLNPTTLQCSHNFCSVCIQSWIPAHKNCPICRKTVTTQPIRNRCLQEIISKLRVVFDDTQKQEYKQREKTIEKQEIEEFDHIQKLALEAERNGLRMLQVDQPWNATEKSNTLNGLAKYKSKKARQYFLKMIGFTVEAVDQMRCITRLQVCSLISK
jgi:hypothetical protein